MKLPHVDHSRAAIVLAAQSDEALTLRWREGDRSAANALFARHERGLRRYFRSRISDGADDLIQQTMLAAVEGQRRFQGNFTFSAYLFAAARFQLLAHYRRRQREALRSVQLEENETHAHSAQTVDAEPLTEALARLPAHFRDVLSMAYGQQLTAPEIASALDIPVATVYSRLRRGKLKLAVAYRRERTDR